MGGFSSDANDYPHTILILINMHLETLIPSDIPDSTPIRPPTMPPERLADPDSTDCTPYFPGIREFWITKIFPITTFSQE